MQNQSARFYAILSIGVALLNIALKFGAYRLTGSVGLLSDALESCVNLVAAIVAVWALTYAAGRVLDMGIATVKPHVQIHSD